MGKRGLPTTTSPVFRRADAGQHASLTCAIFFPIPTPSSLHTRFFLMHFSSSHALLFITCISLHHMYFSSSHALLFTTHFSLPHVPLQHRFLLQHPSQFLFIYLRLRPQFEFFSLSLWPRAPNTPHLKNRNKCSFYKLQVCEPHSFTATVGFQNNHILSCHGGVRHSVRVLGICCKRVRARASRYMAG